MYLWDLGTDNLSETRRPALAMRVSVELFVTYQAGTQRVSYYAQLGLMPVTAFASPQTNEHVLCTCTRSADRPFVRIMLADHDMSMSVAWQCAMPIPKKVLGQDVPSVS